MAFPERRAARREAARAAGRHPAPATEGRSRNMQAIRRSGTKPEVALRSALHRLGYRFRKDYLIQLGDRRVRPDVVFPRQRLAIFVDGCFWHSCPVHGRHPVVNADYWVPKLQRTAARDREQADVLTAADWKVLRIWEHDEIGLAVKRVLDQLGTLDHERAARDTAPSAHGEAAARA